MKRFVCDSSRYRTQDNAPAEAVPFTTRVEQWGEGTRKERACEHEIWTSSSPAALSLAAGSS